MAHVRVLDNSSTSRYQVDDKHHYRHNQQKMDEASGYVKAKTEKPKDEKYYANRPKHIQLFSARIRDLLVSDAALS